MAQERQNIYIAAPGFKGINTQDSPVTQDASFASIAENMVVDKYGRIGARQGLDKITSSATPLGSSIGIETIFEFTARNGTVTVFSTGNNKIFTGTTTLTEVTLPAAYSITANDWKIVSFNNDVYFFQRGHAALVSVAGSTTLIAVTDGGHAAPAGNEVLASFGRLFVADVTNNSYTLFFSDLLDGDNFHGGASGSLDLTTVWPTGYDEIVALSEFNDFLVIFGKRSILLYSGASSPSTMVLADIITNIGCIARDTVQSTGTDLIFLSDTGVRSLGRVIQEKSNPIGDVSKNVRDEMMFTVNTQTNNIKSVYSPEHSFYLLFLSTSSIVYCFDTRGKLEDGSNRVTTWPSTKILCGNRAADGTLYLGSVKGINKYNGYLDDTAGYTLRYYTNPLSFGDASRLKILKEINFTVIGGQGAPVTVNWGYDYTEGYTKQAVTVANASIAEYGLSEYNVSTSEYSATIIIDTAKAKATGSGRVATIGLDCTINQRSLSIQEVNIEALIGRLI